MNVWICEIELYICYVNNDKQTHNDMFQTYTFRSGSTKQTSPAMCAVLAATDKHNTKTLKESAVLLMDDFSEGAGVALSAVLDVLESRMPEPDFITFTETL